MASRKRSFIWTSFIGSTDGKSAKCNICSQIVKLGKGGSTGNLYRHLKTKHPMENIERLNPDRPQTIHPEHSQVLPTSVNIVAIESPSPSFTSRPNSIFPSKSQPSISSFVSKPMSLSRSKVLDEQLVRMVTKEYQPLTLVEDKEFKKFVALLNPSYLLPSRKTLTSNLIPQYFNKVSETVLGELARAEAVALTTDTWTSLPNENYLAVTAHFVHENGELKTYLLNCLLFNDSHTAQNLSVEIKKCVTQWNLDGKIVAVVSDNAANIKAAIRLCNWRHIPCFAHTINLIVQAGISKISNLVVKVKSIVEYFKRSPQAYAKLQSTQKQMGVKELKLKQEMPTRWNSCLEMLERVLGVKDPLISTLALSKPELNTISEEEWGTISEACNILKLYEEITAEMSSQKTCTISKTIFLSRRMLSHTLMCKENTQICQIRDMCEKMVGEIRIRFCNVESDSLLLESTLLDPRLNKHGFKHNENVFQTAYKKVCEKAGCVLIFEETEAVNENIHSPKKKKSLAWEEFDNSVRQMMRNDNPSAAGIIETDKYLNEQLIKRLVAFIYPGSIT